MQRRAVPTLAHDVFTLRHKNVRWKFLCFMSLLSVSLLAFASNAYACGGMHPANPIDFLFQDEPVSPGSGSLSPIRSLNSGTGVVRLPGFIVEAANGDNCIVAISLSSQLTISTVRFVAADGSGIAFSDFTASQALAPSLGQTYRAFVATAKKAIPQTASVLEIEYRSKKKDLSAVEITGLLAAAHVATGQIQDNRVADHMDIVSPDRIMLCLGEADPKTGRFTCPARPQLSQIIPASRTTTLTLETLAEEIDGTCPNPFVPCNCTLNGFNTPCSFVLACLESGLCVPDDN